MSRAVRRFPMPHVFALTVCAVAGACGDGSGALRTSATTSPPANSAAPGDTGAVSPTDAGSVRIDTAAIATIRAPIHPVPAAPWPPATPSLSASTTRARACRSRAASPCSPPCTIEPQLVAHLPWPGSKGVALGGASVYLGMKDRTLTVPKTGGRPTESRTPALRSTERATDATTAFATTVISIHPRGRRGAEATRANGGAARGARGRGRWWPKAATRFAAMTTTASSSPSTPPTSTGSPARRAPDRTTEWFCCFSARASERAWASA